MFSTKMKYIILGVVIIAAGFLVYYETRSSSSGSARDGTHVDNVIDPEFAGYISAFTSGYITSNSTIKIKLSKAYEGSMQLNAPLKEKYFSFEPSISGKAMWRDAETMEFVPDAPLRNGQVYRAIFHLDNLVEVKKELRKFEFQFQTVEQSLQMAVKALKCYNSNDFKYYSLNGKITTSDIADNKKLESTLIAGMGGKNLQVKWTHDAQGVLHHFWIDSIKRPATHQTTLTLTCDGSPLNVSTTTKNSIVVPARDKFLVMDAKLVKESDPYILVNFSNPLPPDRSLEGLVSLKGLKELKYIVNENQLQVYPSKVNSGNYILKIDAGVKDARGQSLGQASEYNIAFSQASPAVRFTGSGNILPSTEGLSIPFEAINLRAVDVTIVKIYENNVLQFLQDNTLSGSYRMAQVGKKIVKKRINLGITNPVDYGMWKKFSIEMGTLFKAERGAIYRVSLSFRKKYSAYACLGSNDDDNLTMEDVPEDLSETEINYFNSYNDYDDYYYEDYNWNERDDPCKDAYYARSNRTVTKNILASDIGITIKKGNDGSFFVVAGDLVTARPMNNVVIELFDYQKQLVQTAKTNSDGQVFMDPERSPAFLVAKKDGQFAYLRLDEGATLPLSMYDVSGTAVKKGVKGFIYGERGVWRPGDSLFLHFILEDRPGSLPANHPVSFSIFNPQGQLYKRITTSQNVNGFYNFSFATDPNAPTGVWNAEVKVGPVKFNKSVRIETIMPNRLKIILDFGNDQLIQASADNRIKLHTSWLTGAVAKQLNVKVNAALTKMKTEFPGYKNYVFDDATRSFEAQNVSVFDGKVDEQGKAEIPLNLQINSNAPGFLKAAFNTMVFEPGGAFSVDRYSISYSPYSFYTGIMLPQGEKNTGILFTERDHIIHIATVDANGKPVSRSGLKFELFKLEWRWWWDQYSGELAGYATDEYHKPVQSQVFSSNNGKAEIKVNIPDSKWGRYLVRVSDTGNGHSSSVVTYFDWANWMERGGDNNDSKILSNMLNFSTDKTNYVSGEEVKLLLPTPKNGRALITIENGSRVLEAHWLETQESNTTFKFKVTPQMAPNIYVHVSLMQPHSRTNDLPIRLYGVVPVIVDDKESHLHPVIKMADILEPEKMVTMVVSEENNKKMAFTLAVVDEGLLDITRFKTPDPHKTFYAKEALGVKTWDIYDHVIGAFGADLERILSIGGDGSEISNDAAKANRFKPMVKCFGPYFLAKGEKKTISFKMPMYVGSVRTMLIAGDNGAYGTAEKTTPVKAPLMILGTLPRVLSVTEEVKLPVTIFGGDQNIGKTEVRVEVNGLLQVSGGNKKLVNVKKDDETMALFDLKVGNLAGIAKVKISASGGGHTATYEMELDVRNPNPFETVSKDEWLDAGKTLNGTYEPHGIQGTNSAILELSTIPPINLEERLKYLISYPHGCIEQTSSQAFAQLYLPDMMDLSPTLKTEVEDNVKAGIQALRKFQLNSGAFSYWPGNSDPSDWGTSYAGHFFLSAEKKGYSLPAGLKNNWISYQQKTARDFEIDKGKRTSRDELQAYRLFVLALANQPVVGAMNRLREYNALSNQARWMLAGAYAQIGQADEAARLISQASDQVPVYRVNYDTYGSTQRDMAIILQSLCLMNKKQEAFAQLKKVSEFLSGPAWLSTQTTAFALVSVAGFINKFGAASALQAVCDVNGNVVDLKQGAVLSQIPLSFRNNKGGTFRITNNGKGVLYIRTVSRGKPPVGSETAANENITVGVTYKDMSGTVIDPSVLEQGTNFMISVTVKNLGMKGVIRNVALSNYIPSGWEIHNSRLDENEAAMKNSTFDYQDIRDDRVFTYFDLFTNDTRTFNIMVNASYEGRYYLPGVNAEAMYDNTIFARTKGQWIKVVRSKDETVAER